MDAPYDLEEFIWQEADYLGITDEEAEEIFNYYDEDSNGLWDDDEYETFFLDFYAYDLESWLDWEAPWAFDEFDQDQDGLWNMEEENDYYDAVYNYYGDDDCDWCDDDCYWCDDDSCCW